MRREKTWHWIRQKAEASFVPCVAAAGTILTVLWVVVNLVGFVLAFGFYLLAAAVVVPVLLLVLRLGGWRIQWREWLAKW